MSEYIQAIERYLLDNPKLSKPALVQLLTKRFSNLSADEAERREAQLLVIELAAARFAELVELRLLQHFVQSSIKRMPRSFRQIAAIPKLLLSLTLPVPIAGKTLP